MLSKFNSIVQFLINKYKFVIFVAIFSVGIIIKIILLPAENIDYLTFLLPWIEFIKSHGYENSLKYIFYDYTPTYIYFLVLIAKWGLNPLFSIKFISFFFEYLLAFFIGKIAYQKHKTFTSFLVGFTIIPILPTVIFNASYLSQCDAIYSALVAGSIYFMLTKRQFLAILFLSIGFVFKMQTVFILPLYFVLLLRKEYKWYYFLMIPLFYIISTLPAVYYGGPFRELAGVYFMQANKYKYLTLNFPNIYIFINNNLYEIFKIAGILFTVLITLFTGFWLKSKKYILDFDSYIRLAFICSILIPFILPGMHERYMFLGDALSVLYFLVFRKNIHFPIGILLVSTYSYIRLSRFNDILPMEPAFVIYTIIIVLAIYDFISNLKKINNETK